MTMARRDGRRGAAIQVPPDGAPIVVLADGPTTGGYPKIEVVVAADLGRLAQLVPGEGEVLRLTFDYAHVFGSLAQGPAGVEQARRQQLRHRLQDARSADADRRQPPNSPDLRPPVSDLHPLNGARRSPHPVVDVGALEGRA